MKFILLNYLLLFMSSCLFLYNGEYQLAIWMLFLMTCEQNIVNRYDLDK